MTPFRPRSHRGAGQNPLPVSSRSGYFLDLPSGRKIGPVRRLSLLNKTCARASKESMMFLIGSIWYSETA